MDRVTSSLLTAFKSERQIEIENESESFEIFSGFSIISQYFDEIFEPISVSCSGGGDYGIDAFALIADGELITTESELSEVLSNHKKLSDVKFVFIQSKTSDSFDGGQLSTFGEGVVSIFKEEELDGCNDRIRELVKIINTLYNSKKLSNKNPDCHLFYVTTGTWLAPTSIVKRIEKIQASLNALNMFDEVTFQAYGAKEIQKAYRRATESNQCTITIDKVIPFPKIDSIQESYIGYIAVKEYLKLITNEYGEIRKTAFCSNVRDFEGENDVNLEIKDTITNFPRNFVLYNNGVTIISSDAVRRGEDFILSDYQIVNGCQSSHIIHACRNSVDENLLIPIKLIITSNDDVIRSIIRATNRQTKISEEQFISLNDFNKELEDYYASYSNNERLYYERRTKQYSYKEDIEKVRIVTIAIQIKAMASMFYDLPHQATAYYGKLLENKSLDFFKAKHRKEPYYLSSYLLYKLEFAFRNKQLDKEYRKYRYHLLMIFKYKHIKTTDLTKSKLSGECTALLGIINNHDKFISLCNSYIKIITEQISLLSASETAKQDNQKNDPLKSIVLIDKIKSALYLLIP